MRLHYKSLLIALIVTLSVTKCLAQYVQPMRYDHYSFTQQANIGVGTARVTNPSAYLEVGPVTGANKGLLPPRLTAAQMNAIPSPAAGLFVYNTDSAALCVYTTVWRKIGSTFDSSGLSNRINLKLNISDTANMRVRLAAGSNITLTGTYPNISIASSAGGTTADSTLISTNGQTDFVFSSVPASYNDYIIYLNGVAIEPATYFTTSTNTITFSTGLAADDRVRYKRIK